MLSTIGRLVDLTGRFLCVTIQDKKSSRMKIKSGVPQRFILYSLLLLMLVNNLFSQNWSGWLQMYANDSALAYRVNSKTTLFNDMYYDLKLIVFNKNV